MSNPFVSFGDFATATVSPPWIGQSSAAQTTPYLSVSPWDETPPFGPFKPNRNGRESFGSVFPGSSGTKGNGNGRDGSAGQTRRNTQPQSSTFNIGIKPKDPPVFHGRANEDIDT